MSAAAVSPQRPPAGGLSATKAFRRSARSRKDERQQRRGELFGLLLYQHRHSLRRSQRLCLKAPVRDQQATLGRRGARAALAHVITCGSADCPWCGVRWSESKAAAMQLAITTHVADGGMVVMASYTLKHGVSDDLADLWGALGKAFTYATNGHRATRAELRRTCLGFIVRKETTHGANGWHPHLHVAYFVRPGVGLREVSALVGAQQLDIETSLRRHSPGNISSFSRRYGVKLSQPITRDRLEEVGEAVAKYMAKDAARELTATGTKDGRRAGNRTTLQLLADAAAGDSGAERAYRVYEAAMKGKRRLRWSPGLASALFGEDAALAMAEATEDNDVRAVAVLPRELYDALRYSRWEGGLGVTDLMNVVEELEDDSEAFAMIAWLCHQQGLPDPVRPVSMCRQPGNTDPG